MQPVIVGPLSELSSSIRVRGQLPGAGVTVETGLRTVAKGTATSGDQRFPLEPGLTLSRSETLFAIQHLGAEQSEVPSGNLAMPVAAAPTSSAEFGPVHVATQLFACGQYVWIDGAVSGADVTLLANGSILGTGQAHEGTARFALTSAIPPNGWITAHQSGPGLAPGPDVGRTSDPLPGGLGQPLPAPVIQSPVRGCDPSVMVSGVFDGATVTIERRSGIVDSAGFDRSSLRFLLSKPLAEDDEITIRQEVAKRCERPPKNSDPVLVGKLEPVDPPVVVSPLCAGATTVRVTGLRPGATVHLAANQLVFDGAAPAEQTWLDCRVPPLTTDPVSATQECCGILSTPAVPVTVDAHQEEVPAAQIFGQLFSCTGTVSVTKAHRGAVLQVFVRTAKGDAAISDQVLALHTNVVIAVTPLLVEGASVFVRQWACSDTGVDSAAGHVAAHPMPGPVEVLGPLKDADTAVGVRGAVPGAVIEVYGAGHEFLGSATADALHQVALVTLIRPLHLRDLVTAQQWLCGRASEVKATTVVGFAAAFGPRPFYVVGHNPNTVADATEAVTNGANGLEPDVQVYEDHPGQLCISHGTGEPSAPSVADYLIGIHQLAQANPQLSLLVFDCKPEVTSPDHGFELLLAIREHLTFDNDLNVILSIGNRDDNQGAFFDRIVDILGPREGLMIDAENDAAAVSNYFTSRGVGHQGYGNGISFMNFILGPYYRYTLEAACGIRAAAARPAFIYVWTVNAHDELREYIRIGVDGAITDDPRDLRDIAAEGQFSSLIRLATRADNPFKPANFGYGLHIHTADKWMAGTDANVTFTLTGAAGSASKTVNTELIKRMESDDWNWVTIPSGDLGALQTLTVQRDNDGNAPDWFLDRIEVHSARFGSSGTAIFDRDIDDTTPFTQPII
ncbi:MAG: PLAT/LH2 domain-containing protein [Arthrobacter sp.]